MISIFLWSRLIGEPQILYNFVLEIRPKYFYQVKYSNDFILLYIRNDLIAFS